MQGKRRIPKLSVVNVAMLLTLLLAAPLIACGTGAFTIQDKNFRAANADATGTLQIFMKNGKAEVKVVNDIQTEMHGNMSMSDVMWSHGLIHQFVGEVKLYDYIFKSDSGDPLTFTVDREKGYCYVSGAGSVTNPDGKTTTLP